MHFEIRPLLQALSGAFVLTIAGCGGGGGNGDAAPDAAAPPAPVALSLSGTAASGAAFTGAVITVVDASGTVVGTSEPVGADGRYAVTLAVGARAPFVVIAAREGASGETQTLVGMLESADSTVANVTPITHLVASRLSPSGDPLRLADDLAAGRAQLDAERVAAAVEEIRQILAPVLAATGTSEADPLKGTFQTDGTGYDRLLDSLRIEIFPADAGSANVEIGIRQSSADDAAAPPVIQFSSTQDVAAIAAANGISAGSVGGTAITSAALVESGTSARISALLQALNECFALPTATRVDSSSVTATAANIVAPACRILFAGNDPASFRNGGATIGGGLNKPFRSMFFDGGTGLVFSQGSYEFTRASDGHVVLGYRSRTAAGDESFGTFVARAEDGKLKLIGNQYDYPGEVVALQQVRRQVSLGQEAFDYYSVGYSLGVSNLTQGGASIFDRVEVTTPRGRTLTLRPRAGRSMLVLQYDYLPNPTGATDPVNGLSNSAELRLRSEYVDAATPALPRPSAKESGRLYFANPAHHPDDASIESLPANSVWTFRYFLASDPGTAAATQTFRARSRPLSIRELRQQGLAELEAATVARLRADANPAGTLPEGQVRLPAGPLAFAWTVPARALAPTTATVFGLLSGTVTPFDDGARVGSSQRAAQIACPDGDPQCNAGVSGAYAANTFMTGLQLGATDATGRSFSSFYSTVKLNP